MKKVFSWAVVIAMVCMLLAGCGAEKKETLRVFNWGEYIADGVIDAFEEEYNCRVIYETYDSNEAMMAKVENSGKNNYDVVFPSEYTTKKMIEKDMLLELDYSLLPNISNMSEEYMGLMYDPENKYSVPYMMNTLAILYNTDMVKEPVDSIGILFDDKYAENVLMLDGMRDTIGMALKYLGYSMNTENAKEIEEAKNLLVSQKKNVLAYVGDQVIDKMINGEAALALVFSGEGNKAVKEVENLAMTAVPKEGSNLAIDTMVILKNTQHKELAHNFINFMMREDIALMNAEETGYTSPNVAAKELLAPEIKNNENYYPKKEDLERCEIFMNLSKEGEKLWSDAWILILAA